jgi:choline dehydrogenase-like flavoprotein
VLLDLNALPHRPPERNYDACIFGAGVAGITLARKLADAGLEVALVEAGGLEFSEESQRFYSADSIGRPYYPKLTRLRFLGGTSNHWSGRCKPFAAIDFERKSLAGLPGWPIEKAELDEHLAEAKDILDLPASDTFSSPRGPRLESGFFVPDAFAKSPPTRFKDKYLAYLRDKPNLHLFLNASLTDVLLGPGRGAVDGMLATDYSGRQMRFSSRVYVLAMGAIENPRMLLASNSQIPDGIGNQSDMVGRCFMEHYRIDVGDFVLADRHSDVTNSFQFFTSELLVTQNGIGSTNLSFGVVSEYVAYGRLAGLKKAVQRAACESGSEAYVRFFMDFRCPGEGRIGSLCEQSPNPNSRIFLREERDALGVPKAVVDWQMNDFDKRTIRTAALAIAQDFVRNDVGRIQLKDYILDESVDIPVNHHSHHMGTTRMAASADHGVVDRDCRVFGTDNLYVAGSSVFSTGGANNPTLPIVQLTLRLADHLTSKLA